MKNTTHFEVWADSSNADSLRCVEQCMNCNGIIIRNKLFNLSRTDALKLWYFLMQKFPKATVKLAPK